MTVSTQTPGQVLTGLIANAWLAQAISCAAKFGIADLLRDGPRSPEDLAAASGTMPGPLRRLLRALAGSGIFAEDAEGRFALTPLAEPLRSDAALSLRAYAEVQGATWVWQSMGGMEHSLRTGEPAFRHIFGMPSFEYQSTNPEAGRLQVEGLASVGRAQDAAILAAYDFRDAGTVVDVAGGQGALLRGILGAAPSARAVLFDLPHVIAMAQPRFVEAGLESRTEFVTGDFFATVPAGGDVYILRKVIHDWYDDEAVAILRTCRAAMRPGARLLLIETLIPEGNEYSYAKLLDLLMLVYPGGQERKLSEYRALLGAAGLDLRQVIPTASAVNILEAVPA